MARDFEWHLDENKDDIVFPSVQAVAVYQNTNGSVVIRQQDSMGGEDSIVVIPLAYVNSVIAAITAAAKVE